MKLLLKQITDYKYHVHHQIVHQVAENVAQNESFVLSKITPASKVPPFHSTNAFEHIVSYVGENVIEKYQVIKLSHLQLTCVKNTWQH